MSSWAESVWIIKQLKALLDNQGVSIKGTASSTTSLSDAIDIIKQFDNLTLLQIDPAETEDQS